MIPQILQLSDKRMIILDSLDSDLNYDTIRPFAVMIPAFNKNEILTVLKITDQLLDLGCIEFCCVGPQAEELHDLLDILVEDHRLSNIITTWHTDYSDACEYFIYAAGGRPFSLLALVYHHSELTAALEAVAEGY
jgi:hypothetical protein